MVLTNGLEETLVALRSGTDEINIYGLSENDFNTFTNEINANTSLCVLRIRCNIGDAGCAAVAAVLSTNTSLRALDIYGVRMRNCRTSASASGGITIQIRNLNIRTVAKRRQNSIISSPLWCELCNSIA